MNSELHSSYYSGIAYVMYYGSSFNGKKKWLFKTEATADVEVVLDNKYFRDWPAVSIRAGNYTSRDDVGEITGAAYVGPGTNGTCQVVDPVKPPPPPISINVTAPNWNLGELPRGDGEKSFTNSTDRLCFAYSGAAVNGRKFVINASSANGVVNNRYLLKNLTDASQTVPYSLRLSGTNTVSLPNAGNTAISFDATGTTCFVPTFKTSVDRLVKDGNYNDVLTFTVVTKS
ncbi:hypothetical protein C5615_20045 [Burkholderia cepacia]|uniref:Uncharacterized protein n=2 Tax=Burkholderia cepacia TaxID=292 RepID=A0A2S8INC1_BURCE|nr:hypothetical protein C5615_20045 [Burkholderia cepacia]